MKLFELKITKEGITISRDAEMCLTGRQIGRASCRERV